MGTNKLAAILIGCGIWAIAAAQEPPIRVAFNIQPQPITKALTDLGEQAGLRVLVRAEDVPPQQRLDRPVNGELTIRAALEKVLADSGLTYEFLDDRTVRVAAVAPAKTQANADSKANPRPLVLAQSRQRDPDPAADAGTTARRNKGDLEEVVVTAARRAQKLSEVPMSIAVVSAEDIEQRGLVNAEDYLRGVPGANQVDSAEGQSIVIRGIESSPRNQNFASGATTATYFGETPTTNTAGLGTGTNVDLKLVDIERVEILRGPQGTAFGSSSMGGAVRTIPVPPQFDTADARVALGYSETSGSGSGGYNAQVIGNLPLIKDVLAIRAVGYRSKESGFYTNHAGSDPAFIARAATPYHAEAFAADSDDVGDYVVKGGRVALAYQPTNALKLTLSYLKQDTETDGIAVANSGTYDQTMLEVAPQHVVRGEKGGVLDTNIDITNGEVTYDLGWGDLLGTYSYTQSGSTIATPYGLFGRDIPLSYYAPGDHRENVGEVRLTTKLQGPLDFLVGLYHERVDDHTDFNYIWFGDPATNSFCARCRGQSFVGDYLDQRELTQKAGYGEVTWKILSPLTLTGGIRHYDYDRDVSTTQAGPLFVTTTTPTSTVSNGSASGNTYSGNLSYKPDDGALFYAAFAQGFRLGKPQPGLPPGTCDTNGDGLIDGTSVSIASTRVVNSDSVDNYELGTKLALIERRLTIDAAIFRMNWSDIPVKVLGGTVAGGCGLTYVTNAGEARSDGVEFQASYQITDAFRLDLGGSRVNAHLTTDAPAVPAFAGNHLPGAPRTNGNLGLQYEFHVGTYDAFVRADSTYVGPFYGNLQQSPGTKAGDYVKVDASARLKIRDLNVDLFLRNLTNRDDFAFRSDTARGDFYGYRLRPRSIGMQIGYTF